MTNYSAAQAISPAIERTKQFLFAPFRVGRFLKLTLVATLTEGGMTSCNFQSGIPHGNTSGSSSPFHMPHIHWPTSLVLIGFAAVTVLILIPLVILISYLLIRLRFSYFDCVLHSEGRIAPAWRRYHRQAMRYLGLTWCVGLAFWVVLIPVGYAVYQHFKPLFQSIASGTPPTFSDFLPMIAIIAPLALLLGLLSYLIDTTLSTFVLPRMALEDASIHEALSEVWIDIEAEPGQYILFILLRFLLSVVGSILGVIALAIPLVILGIIGVLVVLLLKAISSGLAILLVVPAAILAVAFLLVAVIGIGGTIGTFRRNYGILFYAVRYPELGRELWPPPLPPWEPGTAINPAEGG